MKTSLLALVPALLLAQSPSEVRLKRDVDHLASPALEGRGNGEPGLEKAAEHVMAAYKSLGLKPALQRFGFVDRVLRERGQATLRRTGEAAVQPVWGKDVEALGWSADGTLKELPLVFAGFGLATKDRDDLAGLDLKGKVAVLVRSLPSLPAFAAVSGMDRALLARTQRAIKAGAAAVIVVEEGDMAAPLRKEDGPLRLDAPVLSLPARMLGAEVKTAMAGLVQDGQPRSMALPLTLDLDVKLQRPEAQLPNVVALLPGADPALKDEVVVVGAHMDHLGRTGRGSMLKEAGRGVIHPGADDNASGTAVIMEIARSLKAQKPRRSVLFLHFAGEEEGLLGSAHWVRQPTVPLAKVRFMVNFDMVGRMDVAKPTLQMGGLGAPKASLTRARTFAPEGVGLGEDLGVAVGGSDHMSFSSAKVPTLFFFTGLHGDYHRPADTADKLNIKGMALVAEMGAKVALDLANAESLPAWDAETAKLPSTRGAAGARVAFGTVPDFKEDPAGFRISGVSPGTTADGIGMKGGDVLVKFGEKPVKHIYDFMEALSFYKPGDKVLVQWLRDGKPMQAEAVLRGR